MGQRRLLPPASLFFFWHFVHACTRAQVPRGFSLSLLAVHDGVGHRGVERALGGHLLLRGHRTPVTCGCVMMNGEGEGREAVESRCFEGDEQKRREKNHDTEKKKERARRCPSRCEKNGKERSDGIFKPPPSTKRTATVDDELTAHGEALAHLHLGAGAARRHVRYVAAGDFKTHAHFCFLVFFFVCEAVVVV